jgi:hypothetical protein
VSQSLCEEDPGTYTSTSLKGPFSAYQWAGLSQRRSDWEIAESVTEYRGRPPLVPVPPEETGPSTVVSIPSVFGVTAVHTDELDALVLAAEQGSEDLFVRAATQIEWRRRSAQEFIRGVRLALAAGAHLFARQLSARGSMLYPDEPELRKMARVLAPPRVVRSDLPSEPSLAADRAWLRANHARYRGQWIALCQGNLVASADTFSDLRSRVDSTDGLLLTRVL